MCYRPIYQTVGSDRRMGLLIDEDVRYAKPYLRKGLRHPLLCLSCEGFIQREYEDPFARYWMSGRCTSGYITTDEQRVQVYDYRTFKLFHLAVLWRAGVTAARFGCVNLWNEVKIKRHEPRLRDMLLRGDPGPPSAYAILGRITIHPSRPHVWSPKAISLPVSVSINRIPGYEVMFAGARWLWCCSSHVPNEILAHALSEDGTIPMTACSLFDEDIMDLYRANRHRLGRLSRCAL